MPGVRGSYTPLTRSSPVHRTSLHVHPSAMADDLDELTRGVRRMWSTASLTSKLGAKAAGRMLFRNKPAADALDVEAATRSTEAAVATAKKLVERMGQLKGLVMKAGQIASYMPGTLPPAA